jgi:hypothetical protein
MRPYGEWLTIWQGNDERRDSVMTTLGVRREGQSAGQATWFETLRATAGPGSENRSLWARSLAVSKRLAVPAAAHLHVYIARGSAVMNGRGSLGAGDVVCVADSRGFDVLAGPDGAEVLMWIGA